MKKNLQNLALVLVSICVAYALSEVVFRVALPHLPPSVYNNLPRMYQLLGQTSKRDVIPEQPYLLIIGDSYAAGKGDWFNIENKYNRNSRYQATHVLQDALDKDVLAITQSGSGSFQEYYNVLNFFRFHKRRGHPVPLPDTKIFYFYAGNDIADNLGFLNSYSSTAREDLASGSLAAQVDKDFASGTIYPFEDKFLVAQLISGLTGIFKSPPKSAEEYGPKTVAIVAGNPSEIFAVAADGVQEASSTEMDMALSMFDIGLRKVDEEVPTRDSLVVFIPAPQDFYELVPPNTAAQDANRELARRIGEIAQKNGYRFADGTAFFQDLASRAVIHGPMDWAHLNKAGYHGLAAFILQNLPQSTPLRP